MDTANFRNPHHHRSTDVPGTPDYDRLAAFTAVTAVTAVTSVTAATTATVVPWADDGPPV